MDARTHLRALVGKTIPTMTGRPNRIVEVSGDKVIVATEKSPEGQPVSISWVQDAMDRLFREQQLEISVQSVGYRSAFIGAVLLTVPGTEAALSPRRILLADAVETDASLAPAPRQKAAEARPVSDAVPSSVNDAQVGATLDALDRNTKRIPLARWPLGLTGVDSAGLYAFWIDNEGAAQLALGLGEAIGWGRIYVGQAGATAWPSGKRGEATLASRISKNAPWCQDPFLHVPTDVGGSITFSPRAAGLRTQKARSNLRGTPFAMDARAPGGGDPPL